MPLTITTPESNAVITKSPEPSGLFAVTVTGSAIPPEAPFDLFIEGVSPRQGSTFVTGTVNVSGSSWSHVFEIPYAEEYYIRSQGGGVNRRFYVRRPLDILDPKPGGTLDVSSGTTPPWPLEVRPIIGANLGDRVTAWIENDLSSYVISPVGQGATSGRWLTPGSGGAGMQAVPHLGEVWLKADRPGSTLSFSFTHNHPPFDAAGTFEPTGEPGDLFPGTPGPDMLGGVEVPTEWTRYRFRFVPDATSEHIDPRINTLYLDPSAEQSIGGLRLVPEDPTESIPSYWDFETFDEYFYAVLNRIPGGDSPGGAIPPWSWAEGMRASSQNPPPGQGPTAWTMGYLQAGLSPYSASEFRPRLGISAPGEHTVHATDGDARVSASFSTTELGFNEPPATPEVKVLSPSGSFHGGADDLVGYSVTEEATPNNLADVSGGISSMTFDVVANDDTELLMHKSTSLADPNYGVILGEVTGVEIDESGVASVTADSPLRRLIKQVTLEPTSFEDFNLLLRDLLEGAGFDSPEILLESVPSSWGTVYPGGERDLWTWVKELLALHGLEIRMVGTRVVIRQTSPTYVSTGDETYPLSASVEMAESLRRAISEGDSAREVAVTFHETEAVGRWTVNPPHVYNTAPLYPAGGWSEDVKILQVDAGETLEEALDINASIFSVEQPECVIWVDRDERWNSVYSVSGSDGLPIVPQQWIDGGGSLTVRRSDDTRELIVTLTGANLPEIAPFQIAMSAGPSDRYSSLRLMGSGVLLTEKTLTIPTGVSESLVFNETAPSINSELITSLDAAYTAALSASKRHSGSVMEISGFEEDLWRWRDLYYEDPYGGGGLSVQSFGNMPGSRFRTGRRVWRVQQVETSVMGSEFTAREDTTFREFQDGLAVFLEPQPLGGRRTPATQEPNGGWKRQTFEDFNAEYEGMTFSDFTTRPLRRDDVPIPPELTNHWENHILNPSFEQSVVNWTALPEGDQWFPGASLTRVRTQDAAPQGAGESFEGMGAHAAVVERPPGEDYVWLQSQSRGPALPGQWVGARASVRVLEGGDNVFTGVHVQVLDEDGQLLRPLGTPRPSPVDESQVLTCVGQVPLSDEAARFVSMNVDGSGWSWSEPGRFLVDGAMLVVADTEEEVLRRLSTYVDGDSPDSYERVSYWEDGNSPSARENSTTIVRDTGE